TRQTPQTITDTLVSAHRDARALVGFHTAQCDKVALGELAKKGFTRAVVSGETVELEALQAPDAALPQAPLFVLVDRVVLKPESLSRLSESLETSLSASGGSVH